jgi:hypothetical protein
MRYLLSAGLVLVVAMQCHAQLQLRPPGEDTMSNAAVAKWYAEHYKPLLELTNTQERDVTKAILSYRTGRDSMKAIPEITTEQRFAHYQKLDIQMKQILTDVQYADYLRSANFIELRSMKRDSINKK